MDGFEVYYTKSKNPAGKEQTKMITLIYVVKRNFSGEYQIPNGNRKGAIEPLFSTKLDTG